MLSKTNIVLLFQKLEAFDTVPIIYYNPGQLVKGQLTIFVKVFFSEIRNLTIVEGLKKNVRNLFPPLHKQCWSR